MWPTKILTVGLTFLLLAALAPAEEVAPGATPVEPTKIAPTRDLGLAWLGKNQNPDGSWGKHYPATVTSFAVLAILAGREEPFAGPDAVRLASAMTFLMGRQADGVFRQEGHTWIHVQGFATLALSEAWGRSRLSKTKPDVDLEKIRAAIEKAVKAIAGSQSTSGGWWYTSGSPAQHEGSTTVTAVQALASARNYGIAIDEKVLAKGFEYLKKCQNKDGGFDYQLGPGENSMKEGTAADVATLGLMRKFDYPVMMDGYEFLVKIRPQAISRERFPYYGHFYGVMGMRLMRQEFPSFAKEIDGYVDGAYRDVISWQGEDGSWPIKGWMSGKETTAYSTAFATLLLGVPDGRLSVFNRRPPELPETPAEK